MYVKDSSYGVNGNPDISEHSVNTFILEAAKTTPRKMGILCLKYCGSSIVLKYFSQILWLKYRVSNIVLKYCVSNIVLKHCVSNISKTNGNIVAEILFSNIVSQIFPHL